MTIPLIGEDYRGAGGNIGYLLRQVWHTFRVALDAALREHGLSGPQYSALSVLRREPGASGADLARACNTTPQAMTGVIEGLERQGLVERRPHPTHGRILQAYLTDEGGKRVKAATPAVRRVEAALEEGLAGAELATVKEWLAASAVRLDA
ncbi:MAG TPA: MarR family transcriptional regulator [Thermoleophilaceae bacterium]|jgi:DNA-binding MarR family transcriptional regulator